MKNGKGTTAKFIGSLSLLYIIYLLGWINNTSSHMYGLYSDVDGQLAAWYSKALFLWSTPFSMSTLNPFQGMVSLFLPNSSWWNPGALVLSLPFTTLTNYIISYSIYWLEIYFSTYLLARTLGLTKLESVFVPQVFLLFLFPILSGMFWSVNFLSLAPFNAHIFALVNIMVVLYVKLGEKGASFNISLIFLLIASGFILVMSAPVTLITYIPVYGLFCLVLTFNHQTRRTIVWKIATLLVLAGIFLALGAPEYYKSTSEYSASSLEAAKGFSFSLPAIWQKYDICQNTKMNLLCTKGRIYIFHIPAFLGGILCLFWRQRKYQWLAGCFCLIAVIPEILVYLFANGVIKGVITQINPVYYLWSAYPLYSIFFVLLGSFLGGKLIKIKDWHIANFPTHTVSRILQSYKDLPSKIKSWMPYAVIPGLAACVWFGVLAKHRAPLMEPLKTPIVAFLQTQIGVKSGDVFRGSTASYFASKNSPLRKVFAVNTIEDHYNWDHYIQGREYLKKYYGNRHMFSDLWNYDIPTIEEYGQWVSVPMFRFFQKLLASQGDGFFRSFLNVYKLEVKILRALGVHYVIADTVLKEAGLLLVMEQKKLYTPTLYLYKLENPNLASFSPTQTIVLKSAEDIFARIKTSEFLFEQSCIIQESLPYPLASAKNTEMRFERNIIKIKAESDGWSILLLPVQYSHCLQIVSDLLNSNPLEKDTRLIRANLIHSGLLFHGKIDVKLRFEFGIGKNTTCRREDINDLKALGLI